MYLYTDVSLYYYHGFMRRPVATGEYQEGGQQQQNKNNIKKQKKQKLKERVSHWLEDEQLMICSYDRVRLHLAIRENNSNRKNNCNDKNNRNNQNNNKNNNKTTNTLKGNYLLVNTLK